MAELRCGRSLTIPNFHMGWAAEASRRGVIRMALERKASVAVGACVQSFTNHLTPEKDQFGVQNPRISLKKMW
jgi:hypothetical protein